MSPEQALKVLRNLVCDGVRAFDCQKALKTLEVFVLAQQTTNSRVMPCPSWVSKGDCFTGAGRCDITPCSLPARAQT